MLLPSDSNQKGKVNMAQAMRQPNREDTLEYINEYIEDQRCKILTEMARLKKRETKLKKALKLRDAKRPKRQKL